MNKLNNSFQSEEPKEGQRLREHVIACVSALLLAALMAFSTSPAMAQGVGQFNFPTTIPLLSALSDVTPANFLPEVQNLVRVNNARDLVQLGKQAAGIALHIEELQIRFLQSQMCNSNLIPSQYSKEVQIGCDLLGAQGELNKIKQKALDLVAR
ncbi:MULTISPECIES: hypothetical protein [Polaromonas]|uniref:DUF5667 domain-containing protein n=1 Tax=Polaromonas aquatica TaxID=332657 RepID=A0ABW1TZ66_9BURK